MQPELNKPVLSVLVLMSSFAACKTSLSAVIEIRRWSFIYALVHVLT